jgi:peptidoglycan/LPS O-acetylase OafA/YrhL
VAGTRLTYRPGLDGLRALAVAGVVLYHAEPGWLPGGYLGVDLFFVLSGFLITSLLLAERDRTGTVDLGRFWLRRARRLLPAVVVLVGVCTLAAAVLARDDLGRTRADAVASLLYVNNWHQVLADHSYFVQFERPSLLLHLWSLAVEEQFYLVWPLLLLAGLRLFGRRGMVVAIVAGIAASALLMAVLYDAAGDPSRVYYGTDTRASTILVGALLAFLWPVERLRGRLAPGARVALDGFGVAALGLVALAFLRQRDYDPFAYRGGLLLFAIAAAFLIAAVSHPASRLERVFAWAPLVWIGARSYGIYLWHWPVMMLARPRDVGFDGPLLVALQIAATVAIAAVSYRLVEQPIRTGTAQRSLRAWLDARSPRRRLAAVGGALAGVAACVAAAATLSTGTSDAHQQRPQASAAALRPVGAATTGSTKQTAAHGKAKRRAPATRGGLPAGSMLFLGDSVAVACERQLQDRLGARLTIDAAVGRQAEDTVARIDEYRSRRALPPTVIVHVGDNGPVYSGDFDALRDSLAGIPHVIVVNARIERSWQDQVLGQTADSVRAWRQATLADWFVNSSYDMLSDGVHPEGSGCAAFANVIVDALKRSARKA